MMMLVMLMARVGDAAEGANDAGGADQYGAVELRHGGCDAGNSVGGGGR